MDKRILAIIIVVWIGSISLFIYKKAYSNNVTAANYLISKDAISSGDSVSYTDNTPGATKWRWDFGDGEVSTERTGNHTYHTSGTHTVTLKVSGDFRAITDSSKHVTVAAKAEAPAMKPVESFIKGSETAETGKPVRYESMVHAASYEWTLEGEQSRTQTYELATYTFPTPGRHVLVLTTHKPDSVCKKVINVVAAAPAAAPPAPAAPKQNHTQAPHKGNGSHYTMPEQPKDE